MCFNLILHKSSHVSCEMHLTGTEAPSQDAEQSWKLYLPLWSALVSGKGRPADADADVSTWAQPTYDALTTAVLDALRNLDLDYQQEQSMEAAGQAGKLAADVIEVPGMIMSHVYQASCTSFLLRSRFFNIMHQPQALHL